LATPLTTAELLTAKALIAVVPSTILSWACYLLTLLGMFLLTDPIVVAALLRPTWTIGLALLSPLLSVVTTLLAVAVSSRMTDAPAAQGFSAVIILPLVGASLVVLVGSVWVELWHVLLTSPVMAIVAVGGLFGAVKVFER